MGSRPCHACCCPSSPPLFWGWINEGAQTESLRSPHRRRISPNSLSQDLKYCSREHAKSPAIADAKAAQVCFGSAKTMLENDSSKEPDSGGMHFLGKSQEEFQV
jgi:hypothetical protein